MRIRRGVSTVVYNRSCVRGVLDVTRRDDVTRYWGTATAAIEVAPRMAFVGEYRARATPVGDVDRSVWFGLGVTVLQ